MNSLEFIKYSDILIDVINNYQTSEEGNAEVFSKILELNFQLHRFAESKQFPVIEHSLITKKMFSQSKDSTKHFKPADYQYCLLLYLFLNHEEVYRSDLRFLINGFIKAINHKLSLSDINRTSTGAIRCNTNIRFAVNGLRQVGLINWFDTNGKRSCTLTLLGFFVCLYLLKNNSIAKLKRYDDLKQLHTGYFPIDYRIIELIQEVTKPGVFGSLLSHFNILDSFKHEWEKTLASFGSLFVHNAKLCAQKQMTISAFRSELKKYLIDMNDKNDFNEFRIRVIDNLKVELLLDEVYQIINNQNK